MIPLQHIHPMLVHFPIVFFLSLATFDVIATVRGADVTGRSTAGAVYFTLALLAELSARGDLYLRRYLHSAWPSPADSRAASPKSTRALAESPRRCS